MALLTMEALVKFELIQLVVCLRQSQTSMIPCTFQNLDKVKVTDLI